MSQYQDDFTEADWVDFVRELAPREKASHMKRHLEEGCRKCAQNYATWDPIRIAASNETNYEPPRHVVQSVKSAFDIRRKLSLMARWAHTARLVFDSSAEPVAAGIRGGAVPSRHLLHESGDFLIDLRMEQESGPQEFLVGQALPKEGAKIGTAHSGILLVGEDQKILAQTITNAMGEFQLEFACQRVLDLYVQIPEAELIRIAVPDTETRTRD